MLVSYKWLKELVDVDVTTAELAEKMSTTGIEVEGVETPAEGLSKLVVGHVLTCEDVPETHLHLCQVDTGDAEGPRQIVCGAPNVTAGIKVIVAIPGARIADNYKIKKGKIRGMESLGMICSLAELGLPDNIIPKEFADGIQILPEDAVPGDSISHILTLMTKLSNCQSHLTVRMPFLCVVWLMKLLQSMVNLFISQKKQLLKTANQPLIRFQ